MIDFDNFIGYLQTNDRMPVTVQGYHHDLQAFTRWYKQTNGEDPTPERVTPTDLREYRQWMQVSQKYKASTINRRLSAIRTWLSWAEHSGQIIANPADDLRGLPQQRLAPKWLSKRDEAALLRTAEQEAQLARLRGNGTLAIRNQALIILLLNTGLRVSEVSGLRLSEVKLSERKGSLTVQGKRNKERTIPLNANARKAIQAWLEMRPDTEHDYLFVGQRGERLSANAVWRVVHHLAERAGVEGLTPHTLRHTFAKRLIDAGVSIEQVATLLGHSNLNTTRIYLVPGEKDLERAVEYLDF